MKVYQLWHVHTLTDDHGEHDDEKLIGIFSTRENAEKAIATHKDLEGFRDFPLDCFEIHESELDRTNWNDGFTTVCYGK